jgi:hypothetical protein
MQNDKRAAYRNKLADKAAGKNTEGDTEDGQLDRDGQPASKKARMDPDESLGADPREMLDVEHTADEDGGEDESEDGDDEEADQDERLEVEERLEERLEEPEEKEAADEALDNGEDSD